jgi:hypothetical protein
MKWHVTVVTPDSVFEFDIPCKEPGQAFIPMMRAMDQRGIRQDDVVEITMELKDD